MQFFRRGYHIKVGRGLWWHHGILFQDFDGFLKVIHYVKRGGARAAVIGVTTLDEFAQGAKIVRVEYKEPTYSPEQVFEHAVSRLGEESYNVFAQNCESFCTWCVVGRQQSAQVGGWAAAALVIAVLWGLG